jgi:hypothetical protein
MKPTFDVYRVLQSRTHPDRRVRRAWYGRTWQAELGGGWSPRAYTERGVRRKAARWDARGPEWQSRNARRRQWLRAHVTQRSDPFYAQLRKAGKI